MSQKLEDIRLELAELLARAKEVKGRIDASNERGEFAIAVSAINDLRTVIRGLLGRTDASQQQPAKSSTDNV